MIILGALSKGCRILAVAAVVCATAIPAGPAQAQAQGGSIVVQAYDAVTGLPVPSTGLYNNTSVRLVAHAYDSMGNPLKCTPRFSEHPGAGGSNLTFGNPQPDGSVLMTTGSAFGSTEFVATCQENPNLTSKPNYTSVMAQGTNLGTANAGLGLRRVPPSTAKAPGDAAAPGAAASAAPKKGGHAGAVVGGILAGVAIVGAAAYAAGGISSSTDSGSSCPTYSDYCPSGAGNGGGVRQSGCSCPGGTTTATCGSSNGNCGGLYPAGTVLCNC